MVGRDSRFGDSRFLWSEVQDRFGKKRCSAPRPPRLPARALPAPPLEARFSPARAGWVSYRHTCRCRYPRPKTAKQKKFCMPPTPSARFRRAQRPVSSLLATFYQLCACFVRLPPSPNARPCHLACLALSFLSCLILLQSRYLNFLEALRCPGRKIWG